MTAVEFQRLLGEEVATYKSLLEEAGARNAGIGKPRYHNIETYRRHLARQERLRRSMGG